MNRFITSAAVALLFATPVFAQTAEETAVEILNQGVDSPLEQVEDPQTAGAAENCSSEAVEILNQEEDSPLDQTECVTPANDDVAAGEEIFEELEAADETD